MEAVGAACDGSDFPVEAFDAAIVESVTDILELGFRRYAATDSCVDAIGDGRSSR